MSSPSQPNPPSPPTFQAPQPPAPMSPPPAASSSSSPGRPPLRPRIQLGHRTPSTTEDPAAESFGVGSLPPDPVADGHAGPTFIPSPDGEDERREPTKAEIKAGKKLVKDIAHGLVLGITNLLHEWVAQTEAQKAALLWAATEEEAAAIGDPIGNIVNRHAGTGGAANPDVMDGFMAGLGLLTYGMRNGLTHVHLKRAAKSRSRAERGVPDVIEHSPTTTGAST
jgi:hypothetical protein